MGVSDWENQGLQALDEGKYPEAEEAFRSALYIDPKRIEALLGLGAASAYQENYVEAEAAYRQATTLNPESSDAWATLGLFLCSCLFDVAVHFELTGFPCMVSTDPEVSVSGFPKFGGSFI